MNRVSFRGAARAWAPPALLRLYRRLRYGPPPRPRPRHPEAGFDLPDRPLAELFPGIAERAVLAPAAQLGPREPWTMPLHELLILGAICAQRAPARIFEIGTYQGVSTLLMALNSPPACEVLTLDLDPAAQATHAHGLGVGVPAFEPGRAFRGTPAAAKIRQLYGSSTAFDFAPFYGSADLVLVDADHSYEFVKRDTATAFQLLRPGGVIVWDDYLWEERYPECEGVTRVVNALARRLPVFRIAGSRLAVYVDR